MPRCRFHWTREQYYLASSLARFADRHLYEVHRERPPELLREYFALFDRWPQKVDPLSIPLKQRHHYWSFADGIPF